MSFFLNELYLRYQHLIILDTRDTQKATNPRPQWLAVMVKRRRHNRTLHSGSALFGLATDKTALKD